MEFPAVLTGGLTGLGIEALLEKIDVVLPMDLVVKRRFSIPMSEPGDIALLHERGRVSKIEYGQDVCEVEADVPESLLRRLGRWAED